MSESTRKTSERLEHLVVSTRRRIRRNAVLLGFGLMIIAGVGGLTAGAVLDILAPFPVWLRISACSVLLVLVLVTLMLLVLWPAIRPMRLVQIAFLIEGIIGRMHNSLVTVIDLRARKRILDSRIRPLEDRLIKQTAERLAGYRVETVADPRPVRRVALVAATTILIASALSLLLYERVRAAAMRLLMPTRPIAPVTWVRLQAYPGDTSVLFGEPVRLWATVEPDKLENLTLRLRTDKGEYSTYPMQREGNKQFAFTLSCVNTSYDYQVIGGGTWTVPKRITVIRRPIVKEMSAEIQLPDYMKIPQRRQVSELTRQISAPGGSTIHLAAAVSGDVAQGQIHLFRADKQAIEQVEAAESVWFDDDVPGDAELMGKWRWIEEQTYSGSQAHTFNWSRGPYGFRTRLHRLSISHNESLFLYTRLEPQESPDRLRVRALTAGKTYELIWDSSSSPLSADQTEQLRQGGKLPDLEDWFSAKPPAAEVLGVYAGRLPKPGDWTRLEIPADKFKGQDPNAPITLEGLQFSIDKGTILFDRAGALRQTKRTVKQTNLERVESVPMRFDISSDRWIGSIPVAERHLTIEFRNRLGHPSSAMKAIPIIPAKDQHPSVLVERPGRNLALPKPQAVPLIVRACDDFGVADVFIQTGASPNDLDERRELAGYDQPQVNRKVITSLDMNALDVQPGQPVYYRVFAQDLKGQKGTSETFRISLDDAPRENNSQMDRVDNALTGILDNIQELVEVQGQLSAGAVEEIAALPEDFEVEMDESGTVTLLNPDGTVMTAEDIKRTISGWSEGMTEEQRRRLTEMYGEIQKERQELLELSERLYEAAEADESMLILPAEAEALRVMALRARQVAGMFSTEGAELLGEDVMKRLEDLQELTPEQKRELSQLQQQLREIIAARRALAASPTESQKSLSGLMARLQGRQAMEQLQGLNSYLQSQNELLDQLRQEVDALRRQAATAEAKQLDEISGEQQELDPEALALSNRLQELLRQRREKMLSDEQTMPPAPWVPPGRPVEVMPVEADTPEEDPKEEGGPDVDALKDKIGELMEIDELDWWDRPVDVPTARQRSQVDPRFADRDTRPRPSSAADSTTPRQMLMDHQDRLQQTLTANSNDLTGVQDQLSRTIGQLDQLMSRTGTSQTSGLTQMLGSPDLREALGMSSWMARNTEADGGLFLSGNRMGRGGGRGDMAIRTGRIINVGYADDDIAPVEGAALYRLPPWLRQPLIQGMQERGPEAYQPLIEAYYRDLSTELEK
ncbi:MAG: hypothetical protein KAY65_07650 [Planctomycetes bacterium]|nr:hypothetical protein [Planctomycetota bacterium]